MYGFRKVADCCDRTYSHPFFRRNRPELLAKVHRVVPSGGETAIPDKNNKNGTKNRRTPDKNNRGGVKKKSAAVQAVSAVATSAAPMSAVAREGESGYDSHNTTEESDESDIDNRDKKPSPMSPSHPHQSPALKKTRSSCGGGGGSALTPAATTTAATTNGHRQAVVSAKLPRASSSTGNGTDRTVGGGRQLPLLQQNWKSAGIPKGLASAASQQKARAQTQIQMQKSAPAARGGRELSSPWHHHTGCLGGVSNSFNGSWTPARPTLRSVSSSSVETSSPVLLPVNASDRNGSIAPFLLHQSLRPPPLASPSNHNPGRSRNNRSNSHKQSAVVSSSGLCSLPSVSSGRGEAGKSGTAGSTSYRGSEVNAANGSIVTRPASPLKGAARVRSSTTSAGFYSVWTGGGGDSGGGGGGGANNGANNTVVGRVKTGGTDDNPLPLDKAFGFSAAIARCPSFDLIFNQEESVLDMSTTSNNSSSNYTTTNNKSGSRHDNSNIESNNGVLPVSPTPPTTADGKTPRDVIGTPSTKVEPVIGWNIDNLGGAGWGSPNTKYSAAAAPWAALPPLDNISSLPPKPSTESSSNGNVWAGAAAGAGSNNFKYSKNATSPPPAFDSGGMASTAVVDGGEGYAGVGSGSGVTAVGGAQQEQLQSLKRTLSTTHSLIDFSTDVSPLDWNLFGDVDDANAENIVFGDDTVADFPGVGVGSGDSTIPGFARSSPSSFSVLAPGPYSIDNLAHPVTPGATGEGMSAVAAVGRRSGAGIGEDASWEIRSS